MGNGPTNPGTIKADSIARDGYSQSVEIALSKMAFLVLTPGDFTAALGPSKPAVSFRLHTPYPNPTREGMSIAFDLPEPDHAKLAIYDVAGRLVRTLGDEIYPAGRTEVSWDGANRSGEKVAAGVYFVRIESGERKAFRKAIVLR
jgi:hypothetical protein